MHCDLCGQFLLVHVGPTIDVEREDYSPTPEEVIEWGSEHLNADEVDGDDSDIPAPGEVHREKQDDE